MSYSVSNLFADMAMGGNVQQTKETQLFNPDIPQPQVDHAKLKTLKDRSYNALKLPTRSSKAYNNGYLRLPKNPLYKDPRRNNFSMDAAIDPNTIRQLQNPQSAIPNLNSTNPNRLFGADMDGYYAQNAVSMLRAARQNYVNYRDRYELPDKNPAYAMPPLEKPV